MTISSDSIIKVMPDIAYFSMEIGIRADFPIYSGGLGILSGDHNKSAADLGLNLVAITLGYDHSYFTQHISADGRQSETYEKFSLEDHMDELDARVQIPIYDRTLHLRAFHLPLQGVSGHINHIFYLNSNVPENEKQEDRALTSHLYGGDNRYRLIQEAILGIGGIRLLYALGIDPKVVHLNEGHAALASVELSKIIEKQEKCHYLNAQKKARERIVYTVHTPVLAGHDKFDFDLVLGNPKKSEYGILKDYDLPRNIRELSIPKEPEDKDKNKMNMTVLAFNMSRDRNAVAKKNAQVSNNIYRKYGNFNIRNITNGVHHLTWTSDESKALYDTYMPGWRENPCLLETKAEQIPLDKILEAHEGPKSRLVNFINTLYPSSEFDNQSLIIGFARRFASYKRGDLIFRYPAKLVEIANKFPGGIKMVFAGKAHPHDEMGKDIMQRIHQYRNLLGSKLRIVIIPNYNMNIGAMMTQGCDIWLNNPIRPREASGTSGMKAAMNGVLNLSIDDGWWCEVGEDFGGWKIGKLSTEDSLVDPNDDEDALAIYDCLDTKVRTIMLDEEKKAVKMRQAIQLGGFYNTHRMVMNYFEEMYFPHSTESMNNSITTP